MTESLKQMLAGPPDLPPPEPCLWWGEVDGTPAKVHRHKGRKIALILLPPGGKIVPVTRRNPVKAESLRPEPKARIVRKLMRMGVVV